jgi:mRNA-degrading endonuclease toxin of MazEF toxin-antitoxin module
MTRLIDAYARGFDITGTHVVLVDAHPATVLADCALSFDTLTRVPKALLTERITEVPAARLDELCGALRAATGC